MPKHKVFVDEYGRSSAYAIKKRAKETTILIPGDEHEGPSGFKNDISPCISSTSDSPSDSSSDSLSDSSSDSANYRGIADVIEDDINDSRVDVDNDSEALEFNDSEDLEFDDSEAVGDPYDSDQPLYPGASLTLGESMVSILTFVVCTNLTVSTLCNLLSLISLHCLQPNLIKSSVYLFRKHFSNLRFPIIKHNFCSTCLSLLQTSDSTCETCGIGNGMSYFIEIPLLTQLQVLFQRRGFYESLQHRFSRKTSDIANLEDLYDGRVYRELFDNDGFLSNPNHISFTWNTDGVPLFKSSGYQIWPFYLSINELPYAERTKSDNILLAGLWFGQHKPAPNLFLGPLHSALEQVFKGIDLNVQCKDDPIKVRGMVICGTCDLPAKALFLNMTQFNGKFGCPKCKLRGKSVARRWTYPFGKKLDPRTDEETRGFAEEALRTNTTVYGVKGPSLLSAMVHKYIRTTVVDPMHCIFSGITKLLLTIMFDPDHSSHPASLRTSIDLVDSRLCNFTPPDFLQRRPRSIAKHLKYWKANELKAWLLYYSLPVLCGILPANLFEHYSMFVISIWALHQSSISTNTLEYASRLLTDFVNRFDVLYGAEYMSCNLHQLLHLPEMVRDLGPLWDASCFPYEDMNGKLKSLVHSSRGPELQICSALSSILAMATLRHQNLVHGSCAYDFCSQLSSAKRKIKLGMMVEGICSVGRCRETLTLPEIESNALARAHIAGRKYVTFSRLRKDGTPYTSRSYCRFTKYDNTCVQYRENNTLRIGIVKSFVKIYICECEDDDACQCYAPMYAFLLSCTLSSFLQPKLLFRVPELVFKCTRIAEEAVAVRAEDLASVGFLLKIKDTATSYIALRANATEVE